MLSCRANFLILQSWEEQNPAIKSNSFVSALIQDGIYNDTLLPQSWFDVPIQTILEDFHICGIP